MVDDKQMQQVMVAVIVAFIIGFFTGYQVMYELNVKPPQKVIEAAEEVIRGEFDNLNRNYPIRNLAVKDIPRLYFQFIPSSRFLLSGYLSKLCGPQDGWREYSQITTEAAEFTSTMVAMCKNLSNSNSS